jgi:hypothetical protein
MKNIDSIKSEIFDQIKKTYQINDPNLSQLLTLDNVTGKEADTLGIQLKKAKKQYIGYLILTVIGFVTLTVFTFLGLFKSIHVSASLGLLAIIVLTTLAFANKSKMFIKAIESQIFLYQLLYKVDNEFVANEK